MTFRWSNLASGRLEPPTSSLWETRSNLLSYEAINLIRWGGDSNPRTLLQVDSLAVSWLKPLIHLTTKKINAKKVYIEFLLFFKGKKLFLYYCYLSSLLSMDESISFIENWETWNNSAEWVTEQDIQKIQEEARQIKKVAQELKNSKAANGQFAKFLSFLMRTITN